MEKLKFKELLIHCCLLLTLLGCAGKSESLTDFDVKIAGLTALNQYSAGGAFLIGTQVDGTGSFLKRIDNDNSDTLSLELPNGTWDFHVIMWDGDHDADGSFADGTPAFTGIVRCGSSPSNLLDGSDLTVALTANNGNCADPIWGTPMINDGTGRGINKFEQTTFFHCRKPLSEVTSSSDCMTDEARGLIHSARVVITPFKQFPGEGAQFENGNSLGSVCLKGSGGSDTLLSVVDPIDALSPDIHFPWGPSAGKGIPFNIQVFYKDNCDDSGRGLTNFIVPNGLKAGSGNIRLDETNGEVAIFTPESLACAPPRGGLTTDFSVVLAGTLPEYGICNKEQFALIPAEFSSGRNLSDKNIHLFSDINYFAGQNISPSNPPSVSNFPMIGDAFIGNESTSAAYTGTFDGHGHRITGLTIDLDDETGPVSKIGFVRKLNGKVKNLTFILPEVYANDNRDHGMVGIVAGTMNGGTLENLSIIIGTAEGRTNVGLFAGSSTTGSNFRFLDSRESEVEGSRNIGGIVGSDISGIFEQVEFQGQVVVDSNGSNEGFCLNPSYYDSTNCTGPGSSTWHSFENFGGLIGKADGSLVERSTSKGVILGGAKNGGLFGEANGVTVNDAYTLMTVLGSRNLSGGTEGSTGGLVGELLSTGSTFNRVFHTLGTVANPGSDQTVVNPDYGKVGTAPGETGVRVSAALAPTFAEYNQFRSSASMGPSGFTEGNGWRMDDDGYDVPILAWESARRCSGKFADTFAGGDGSADNPYLICSPDQLENMSDVFEQNYHYRLARPIDAIKIVKAMGPMLPDATNLAKTFKGTFDGDGYFINNTAAFAADSNPVGHGLFSEIAQEGVVKNVRVVGTVSASDPAGRPFGLIAGINRGLIERVTAFGSVDGTATSGIAPGIGGIVGTNFGAIVGTESFVRVKGHGLVGGIAGENTGGLILYSKSSSTVSPAANGLLTKKIGGIVGSNTEFGGAKTFTDIVNNEDFSYNGSIIQSTFEGELTTRFGPAAFDIGLFYEAGLVAGRNEGTIADVSLYGKLNLELETNPAYDNGAFDASTDTPTANQIFTVSAGTTGRSIDSSQDTDWDIGDLIYKPNSGATIRIPTAVDGSGYDASTPTTTIISPFIKVGFIAGHNSATGSINNTFVHQHSDYLGLEYFGQNFGYFVGFSETATPVANSIFEGQLNFNGANNFLATATTDNNKFISKRMGINHLMFEVDTAQYDGSVTVATDNSTDLSPYGLTTSDFLGLGNFSFNSSVAVSGTDISVGGLPIIATATPFPLYIPNTTTDFDSTNFPDFFSVDMGWDVGDYDTGNVWEEEDGGSYSAYLIRPWQYAEHYEILDYIALVNGGAPTSIGLDTLFTPENLAVDQTVGPAIGGQVIRITGDNITPIATITIGGMDCTPVTVIDANTVDCTSPSHTAGIYDIVVTNDYDQSGTLAGVFSIVDGPSASSVAPGTITTPGDIITITGINFDNVSGILVGGTPCDSFTVDSSTQVSCITPAAPGTGTHTIDITDIWGQADTSQLVTYP